MSEEALKYYDVLYGQVRLDSIVPEILDKCWEVRRLKDVGLMNFRSMGMLPLTQCSRLEHAIGTAYLSQMYAERQGFDRRRRRTLVAAALLHDISCAPFGHSVEWALLASGRSESHEAAALWVTEPRASAAQGGRPAFLDSKGFEPAAFDLDLELFRRLQEGRPGHAELTGDYMDLDNIDNVFRMARYLGFSEAGSDRVHRLVHGLTMQRSDSHFTVEESVVQDVVVWHRLRHDVYRLFIYDAEYLSFECQLFEFVRELLDRVNDSREVERLVGFPDDVLLWQYFSDPAFIELRPLIRRLIASDAYRCVYIGRVENPALCKALPSALELDRLRECFLGEASRAAVSDIGEGPLSRWLRTVREGGRSVPPPLHIHVTTDKRKTARQIQLSVRDSSGLVRPLMVGEDGYFLVAALFTETPLERREVPVIAEIFARAVSVWGSAEMEPVYVMTDQPPQLQLPI